ncbi:MAG: Crp/Fnr family transcriptional regulator [Eubacteriales bacterium]|nr:Crp/Fnr family transcriptional regulator [Eubacteriales bacterium]
MKNFLGVIRKCSIFNNIEDQDLESLLSCLGAKIERKEKGSYFLSEGEPAKFLGIVLTGKVQIERIDYSGNRSILSTLEPSQIFGEAFACAGVDALPISVVATENTEVMLIDARRIMLSCSNACGFHNRLIFNLLKIVSWKNIEFNRKVEISSKRSTREKLMTYLDMQAKQHGRNNFTIPYDRQALADYLGVERSGLSAEISKLRNEGIIKCHRSEFTLL